MFVSQLLCHFAFAYLGVLVFEKVKVYHFCKSFINCLRHKKKYSLFLYCVLFIDNSSVLPVSQVSGMARSSSWYYHLLMVSFNCLI